jgi:hypothetical protein
MERVDETRPTRRRHRRNPTRSRQREEGPGQLKGKPKCLPASVGDPLDESSGRIQRDASSRSLRIYRVREPDHSIEDKR